MKQVILLRHAKSLWQGTSDFDRPCETEALAELNVLRDLLITEKFVPDCVLSSPALRTVQTIQYVCKGIYPDKKITYSQTLYENNAQSYFNLLQELNDAYHRIILCAHNPSITELASHLLKQSIAEVQPGEFIWLELSKTDAVLKFRD